MYAAVCGSASGTSRLWPRGLACIRGTRFSTSAKKTPTDVDKEVAEEIASVAACKTPLKVSRPRALDEDLNANILLRDTQSPWNSNVLCISPPNASASRSLVSEDLLFLVAA